MLDVVSGCKIRKLADQETLDLGGGCSTVVFIADESDVLQLFSGDATAPTDAVTGGDASDADGSDGFLMVTVIRPTHRYYKVNVDTGASVYALVFGNRDESVSLDALCAEHVVLNSPDSPDQR